MPQVIFTADDYGVHDPIDNAIIKAVLTDRINSVAILPNAGDLKSRIDNLHIATRGKKHVELGCHLTFCSGKPLIDNPPKNFTNGKNFKPFGKIKRAHERDRDRELAYINKEICMQIDRVESLAGEVKHLTCHHNTLFWFKDYFLELLKVSKDKNIPIRSPYFTPDSLFEFYKRLAIPLKNSLFAFRGNKTGRAYRKWQKENDTIIPDWLAQYDIKYPNLCFTNHYGPAGGLNLKDKEIDFQVAQRKHVSLTEMIADYADPGEIVEVVFHLIKDDFSQKRKFRKVLGRSGYKGINRGYVDGRMAEMRSLMSFNLPTEIQMVSWSDLKTTQG